MEGQENVEDNEELKADTGIEQQMTPSPPNQEFTNAIINRTQKKSVISLRNQLGSKVEPVANAEQEKQTVAMPQEVAGVIAQQVQPDTMVDSSPTAEQQTSIPLPTNESPSQQHSDISSPLAPTPPPAPTQKVSTNNVVMKPQHQRKFIVTNPKDKEFITALSRRVQELENKCANVSAFSESTAVSLKGAKDKISELAQAVEKKASLLDIKKINGSLDETNESCSELKKEMEEMKKTMQALEENEELKCLKLKHNSLESKVTIIIKNTKEMEAKILENMGLQIMPQSSGMEEEKIEELLHKSIDEVNKK